jgi:hypothetical protein
VLTSPRLPIQDVRIPILKTAANASTLENHRSLPAPDRAQHPHHHSKSIAPTFQNGFLQTAVSKAIRQSAAVESPTIVRRIASDTALTFSVHNARFLSVSATSRWYGFRGQLYHWMNLNWTSNPQWQGVWVPTSLGVGVTLLQLHQEVHGWRMRRGVAS